VETDIWSLGCTLYNLMFSRTPFESQEGLSSLAVMSGRYMIPDSVPVSAILVHLVSLMLTVNPAERADWPVIKAMLTSLDDDFANSNSWQPHTPEPPSTTKGQLSSNHRSRTVPTTPTDDTVTGSSSTGSRNSTQGTEPIQRIEFANFDSPSSNLRPERIQTDIPGRPLKTDSPFNPHSSTDWGDFQDAGGQGTQRIPSPSNNVRSSGTLSPSVLKRSPVFVMRYRGFPRRLVQKRVWLLLGSNFLLLQKNSASSDKPE
jgi:serine/threonine protein kinase